MTLWGQARGHITPTSKWDQQGEFTLGKNTIIYYLQHMMKFANFEFIFTIRDPKLAKRGQVNTQNREVRFYFYPKKLAFSPCKSHFEWKIWHLAN